MRDVDDHALVAFGRRLYEWRRQTGLSQRVIAHMAEVDQAWLSRVERGLMPHASMHLIARLIRLLDDLTGGWAPSGPRPSR